MRWYQGKCRVRGLLLRSPFATPSTRTRPPALAAGYSFCATTSHRGLTHKGLPLGSTVELQGAVGAYTQPLLLLHRVPVQERASNPWHQVQGQPVVSTAAGQQNINTHGSAVMQ